MPKCKYRISASSTFRIRHSTFSIFVLEQLSQRLGGDVLVLETTHFGEKLRAENTDVGLLQPREPCGATGKRGQF